MLNDFFRKKLVEVSKAKYKIRAKELLSDKRFDLVIKSNFVSEYRKNNLVVTLLNYTHNISRLSMDL